MPELPPLRPWARANAGRFTDTIQVPGILLTVVDVPYFLFLFVALSSFWLLLSGYWDHPLLLGVGLGSSLFGAWIGVRLEKADPGGYSLGMLLRLPRYLLWLLVAIVSANIDVVRRVWQPARYPIAPETGRVPTSQRTRLGKTIYANSITLTPGTVAIEVADREILVHALTADALDELLEGEMDRRVTRVEGRAR
ncbi:MAG: Na+/H+ antiporter subunit E [Thiohalocapsa sp.]